MFILWAGNSFIKNQALCASSLQLENSFMGDSLTERGQLTKGREYREVRRYDVSTLSLPWIFIFSSGSIFHVGISSSIRIHFDPAWSALTLSYHPNDRWNLESWCLVSATWHSPDVCVLDAMLPETDWGYPYPDRRWSHFKTRYLHHKFGAVGHQSVSIFKWKIIEKILCFRWKTWIKILNIHTLGNKFFHELLTYD